MTAGGIVAYHEELIEFIKPKLGFGAETPKVPKVEVETPSPAPAPGADIPKSAADAKVAKFEPIKVELDGTSVEKVNQNIKGISDSLKQIDFSKLMVPANISSSVEASNNKLKELNDTLKNTTNSFNDLNNANLSKLTDTITKLNESVTKMSNQPGADSKGTSATKVSAKTSEDILSELGVKLDQLNSTMSIVASGQSDAVDYLSKTAKNTRQSVGNMLG
jgi:ABC-type transporter Mla subunit MlaD